LLKLIFAALERQTLMDFEVVIADDGSAHEAVTEIKDILSNYSFPIRHIWHEDDGWRKNVILNKAEKISKDLTLDKVQNGYLDTKLILPLLFESVFSAYKTHFENIIRIRNPYLRRLLIKDKVKGFWGCNFSTYKANILKVNGFDERFVYPAIGEDTDIEKRLIRIGVLPISKKHMITQYHFYHIHCEPRNEANLSLYAENNINKVTYTPFGINKTQVEQ